MKQSLTGCRRAMLTPTFLRIGVCLSLFVLLASAIGAAGGYKTVFMGELREAGATIAHSMNRVGQVVGESGGIDGDRQEAFTWQEGSSIQPLAPLPGGDYSQAFGVNDAGLVVGSSNAASTVRAVLWNRDGKIYEIGALPGDTSSQAFAVNNRGEVVGFSSGSHGIHAFFWSKTDGMRKIGSLPGGNFSEALAINDAGQVVGMAGDGMGYRGFLWTTDGGIRDLNNMLPADAAVLLVGAFAINNRGQIATYGGPSNVHVHHFNAPRGYLLNPFGVADSKDAAAHKTSDGEMPGMQGMESGHGSDPSKGNTGRKISVQ